MPVLLHESPSGGCRTCTLAAPAAEPPFQSRGPLAAGCVAASALINSPPTHKVLCGGVGGGRKTYLAELLALELLGLEILDEGSYDLGGDLCGLDTVWVVATVVGDVEEHHLSGRWRGRPELAHLAYPGHGALGVLCHKEAVLRVVARSLGLVPM